MIKVNGYKLEVGHFPDGTFAPWNLNSDWFDDNDKLVNICWYFDSNEEIILIRSLCRKIRRIMGKNVEITLDLPYVPNARMDRIHNVYEMPALRDFCEDLNECDFDTVNTINVHSDVSKFGIKNINNYIPESQIWNVIEKYDPDVIFFPDEGARKRYLETYSIKKSLEAGREIAEGMKKRKWSTNEILGLDVISDADLTGKKILIIDDICSAGGTFKFSAKKLKELGAKDVALYVTHCEDNIQNGELLKTDLISKIYTTDSILHISDPKIEIIEKYRNYLDNSK